MISALKQTLIVFLIIIIILSIHILLLSLDPGD
jgi:hypothetical protein